MNARITQPDSGMTASTSAQKRPVKESSPRLGPHQDTSQTTANGVYGAWDNDGQNSGPVILSALGFS